MHGRQAAEGARLLAHQRPSASPGSGSADDRGVQKNFPATLSAHVGDIAMRKPIEIWFQDEARLGQKNGLVRQWARRGTRPRQPADQRYESAYLFGAICPARGTGAALALPFADTQAMQLHLDEIARTVKRGAHAALLLDRAGWHTVRPARERRALDPPARAATGSADRALHNAWPYFARRFRLAIRRRDRAEGGRSSDCWEAGFSRLKDAGREG